MTKSDAFTDDDEMPFGKHKGTPMEKVPTKYLVYLWEEGIRMEIEKPTDRGRVARYIFNNRGFIGVEAEEELREHARQISGQNPTAPSGCVIVFDTETNDLPEARQYNNPRHPKTPYIAELGAALFGPEGQLITKYQSYVKPEGWAMSLGAEKTTGLTTEFLLENGKPIENVIIDFHNMWSNAPAECRTLIAHNISFDMLVYEGACIRLQLHPVYRTFKRICTMSLATNICKLPGKGASYKFPKLQEAHRHFFGSEFTGAHGAMADLFATYRIFRRLFDLPDVNF